MIYFRRQFNLEITFGIYSENFNYNGFELDQTSNDISKESGIFA